MPDRLDDVEGFFGLEEVDDVDIVNEDGKIGFQVCCYVSTASLELVKALADFVKLRWVTESLGGATKMEIEGSLRAWG